MRDLLDLIDRYKNYKLIKKEGGKYKASAFLITLTYDKKLKSKDEAWQDIGKEYNKFASKFWHYFGKNNKKSISLLRSWESFGSGYPHIHVIVVFDNLSFRVKKMYSHKENKYIWRLYDLRNTRNKKKDVKKLISSWWHSFVDIRAIDTPRGLLYSLKYILKDLSDTENNKKQLQTLGLCWFFRKRSFSISPAFEDHLREYLHRVATLTPASTSKASRVHTHISNFSVNSITLQFGGSFNISTKKNTKIKWFFMPKYSPSPPQSQILRFYCTNIIFANSFRCENNTINIINIIKSNTDKAKIKWKFVGVFSGRDLGIEDGLWKIVTKSPPSNFNALARAWFIRHYTL